MVQRLNSLTLPSSLAQALVRLEQLVQKLNLNRAQGEALPQPGQVLVVSNRPCPGDQLADVAVEELANLRRAITCGTEIIEGAAWRQALVSPNALPFRDSQFDTVVLDLDGLPAMDLVQIDELERVHELPGILALTGSRQQVHDWLRASASLYSLLWVEGAKALTVQGADRGRAEPGRVGVWGVSLNLLGRLLPRPWLAQLGLRVGDRDKPLLCLLTQTIPRPNLPGIAIRTTAAPLSQRRSVQVLGTQSSVNADIS